MVRQVRWEPIAERGEARRSPAKENARRCLVDQWREAGSTRVPSGLASREFPGHAPAARFRAAKRSRPFPSPDRTAKARSQFVRSPRRASRRECERRTPARPPPSAARDEGFARGDAFDRRHSRGGRRAIAPASGILSRSYTAWPACSTPSCRRSKQIACRSRGCAFAPTASNVAETSHDHGASGECFASARRHGLR